MESSLQQALEGIWILTGKEKKGEYPLGHLLLMCECFVVLVVSNIIVCLQT